MEWNFRINVKSRYLDLSVSVLAANAFVRKLTGHFAMVILINSIFQSIGYKHHAIIGDRSGPRATRFSKSDLQKSILFSLV